MSKTPRVRSTKIQTASNVDEYAAKIKAAWQKSLESILETGSLLIEAKEALKDEKGHGKWLKIFDTDRFPFGERTAQALMYIARHPILSNPKYISDLPPSWGTLYALSQLSAAELQTCMDNGEIHSEMGLKHVKQLLAYRSFEHVSEALNLLIHTMRDGMTAVELADQLGGLPSGHWSDTRRLIFELSGFIKDLHAAFEDREKEKDAHYDEQMKEMQAKKDNAVGTETAVDT